jgi:hypothetical protein
MQRYLLLKTHNTTGLQYLCKFTERVKIKSPFKYKGSGTYWKSHLNKHGNNVSTDILYKGYSEKELVTAAIFWSNVYDVVKNKQFANLIPENGLDGGVYGRKHSEEQKRKISKTLKGRKLSEEHRRNVSEAATIRKRRPHSEETKIKISEAQKGKNRKPFTDEHKRKLSEARKGKKHSEETIRKMSESQKGKRRKPHLEETKRGVKHAYDHRSMEEFTKRVSSQSPNPDMFK